MQKPQTCSQKLMSATMIHVNTKMQQLSLVHLTTNFRKKFHRLLTLSHQRVNNQLPTPSGCLACPGLRRRSASWAPQFPAGVKWLQKKQKSSRTLKLQHPGVKLDGALQTSTHWTMLLEIWTVPCVRTLDVYSSPRSQRRNMAFLFHFSCRVRHAIVCFLIILCHLVLGQSTFTTHSKWTTDLFFFGERLVWVMRPWTNFVPCLA